MKIEKKQMTLLCVTVAAVGFLGWQIYGLMCDDLASAPSTTKSASAAPAVTTAETPRVQATVDHSSSQTVMLNNGQQAYLDLVNRYEAAKLQHKLLDEEVAIARARHDIAETNQKTDSMGGSAGSAEFGTPSSETPQNAPFSLAYLDEQNGRWSATIAMGGEYQSVTTGSELRDGTRVLSVGDRGVLLQSGTQQYQLSFGGMMLVADASPTPLAQKKAASVPQSIAAAQPVHASSTKAAPASAEASGPQVAATNKATDELVATIEQGLFSSSASDRG